MDARVFALLTERDPSDHSGTLITDHLTRVQRLRLNAELMKPRPLLGYALLQVNPAAAHAFSRRRSRCSQ